MATIEKSILIGATTAEIDQHVLDASTWPEWFNGVESVRPDELFPQPGGVVEVVYRSMGATLHLTMTSEELVIGSHLIFRMDGMITGAQNWRYEPEGGGTRVACQFDYDLPGGGVGKMLDKVLFHKTNSHSIEESLRNLKARIER